MNTLNGFITVNNSFVLNGFVAIELNNKYENVGDFCKWFRWY